MERRDLPHQSASTEKRAWHLPTIADEDAKNTAVAKAPSPETATTNGAAS
jgi:hypothetical protein